ncbi:MULTISPECIES: hypothetical protein [Acetobacter]|jgi:hypothetical protein|uniref:CdiI C-terminal domain-containing protein n=2 Tax=Acetobacter TaxID=434 RepID=A0A841QCV1_9PROT|nr:hypothetical protein [Acetobacter lovaniensis]MBB6456238.1 hypothetical protein [Acetobacter lovaniensis]MCI1697941.1 hypothetical protein [Acetobacter lovaniensis]MCP1239070.1 hypothetical protein [Acetobacter lovaniensis]NHN80614.1 hypothetical protein [Acetobacter lovaniensis]GBQ73219.1 hypothetical protein AA0474_2895 [Acetobacter lovaniensis NRIC 0474]
MFDLFLEKSGNFYDEDGYWGKIIINDFNERFFSNTTFFDKASYQKQWRHAAELLLKKKKSYFLVDVHNPNTSNFFMSWPCYLQDDIVYLQNKMILADQHPLDKIISNEADLGDLRFTNEDDQKISTWETDIQSFVNFLDKINKIQE